MGWLIFSDLYSIYVERFSGYGNLYGSVYAVALSMLWLYCCMSILFFGGALNRWLDER
jgi:membrane protein